MKQLYKGTNYRALPLLGVGKMTVNSICPIRQVFDLEISRLRKTEPIMVCFL